MAGIPEDFMDNIAKNSFLPFGNIPPGIGRHSCRHRNPFSQKRLTFPGQSNRNFPPVGSTS